MDSYSDLLNLNFMYSLRTGNLLTDMLVASFIPFLSAIIAYILQTLWPTLIQHILAFFFETYHSTATFTVTSNPANHFHNQILRDAVASHLSKNIRPTYQSAELLFSRVPGTSVKDATGFADAMSSCYNVVLAPTKGRDLSITKQLTFSCVDEAKNSRKPKEGEGKKKKKNSSADANYALTETYGLLASRLYAFLRTKRLFSSSAEQGPIEDHIQGFLDDALNHYRVMYKDVQSSRRYLYQPLPSKSGIDMNAILKDNDSDASSGKTTIICNRYALEATKTFNALFFPAKVQLLKLIDDFMNKTGKYAIPGYPQKLVLLLYGPPGTGKTSLAKSLAHYTKRDLFAISLSRIHSDEELIKCMFSSRVALPSNASSNDSYMSKEEETVKVDPQNLVYILEDIDATTDLVLRDETGPTPETEVADAKTGVAESRQSSSSETASNDTASSKNSEPLREVVDVTSRNQKPASSLTIRGLTEALNGVLDFPQRIIVMTTNHVEHLHSELVRPGVVTMRLQMSNLDAESAVQMVAHYFSHTTMSAAQEAELRATIDAPSGMAINRGGTREMRGFSPSELEQLCAECDTVDELLQVLKNGSRINIF